MKNFSLSFTLTLSLLICILACHRKPDVPALTPADPCPNAGTFVRRVQQQVGTVYYDRTRNGYGIQVATSMDSADMGFSCNLPATYQQELTRVRFTGSYYTDGQRLSGPLGTATIT